MRLSDLDAKLVRRDIRQEDGAPREYWVGVDILANADGVSFLCPVCFMANSGPVGTHSVMCWFVGKVPDDADPRPGRWSPTGSTIEDLTFVGPAAASIAIQGGCYAHFYVRNGAIDPA